MTKKNILSAAFSLLIVVSLIYGWSIRQQLRWTAEEGVGYAMGIIGSTMMLLLLLYPLRKRLSFMRSWIPVKYWFGAHMVLGVLGPTFILFHSNFGLGSLNSNVALYSMLSVSLSGLLGRFFYIRIHKGLYGKKIQLSDLKQALETQLEITQIQSTVESGIKNYLDQLHHIFDQSGAGLSRSLQSSLQVSIATGNIRRNLKTKQKTVAGNNDDSDAALKKYLSSARRLSAYMVYESLFSWWHIIHIPLFIILMISAMVHILAVHMY